MLIDVHAHLDDKKFGNQQFLDEVINRAKAADVKVIIVNGLNRDSNRNCIALSKKYDIIKCALGMYPQDSEKLDDKQLQDELEFIEHNIKDKNNKNKIVAIGEVGLDFYWTKPDEKEKIEKQKRAFEKLIDLSIRLDVPIIVHSRKSEQECVEMLEQKKAKKVVMHCFSGNKNLVERIIKNKWFFSIPANINNSEHFQMIVKLCPLQQILTETDAPYLSPTSGAINEPANVAVTIKKIAELRGMTAEETEKNIFMNYQKLFI